MRRLNINLVNNPQIDFSVMLIDPLKESTNELINFCTNTSRRNLSRSIINGLNAVESEVSEQNNIHEHKIKEFTSWMQLSIEHLHRGLPKKAMQRYLPRLITLIENRAQGAELVAKIINNIQVETEYGKEVVDGLSKRNKALTEEVRQVLTMLNKMDQDLKATWFSSAHTLLTKCIGGLGSGASYILAPFKKLANMLYKAVKACFTKICDTFSQAASFVKNATGFTRAKEQTHNTAPRSPESSYAFNKQKVSEQSGNDFENQDVDFNLNPNITQRR